MTNEKLNVLLVNSSIKAAKLLFRTSIAWNWERLFEQLSLNCLMMFEICNFGVQRTTTKKKCFLPHFFPSCTFSNRCVSFCSLIVACEMTRKVDFSNNTTCENFFKNQPNQMNLYSRFHLVCFTHAPKVVQMLFQHSNIRDKRINHCRPCLVTEGNADFCFLKKKTKR